MKIRIKDLRLRTIVGVYDWERSQPQEVLLNIELEFDGTKAGASDRLEDTVDYKALKRQIIDVVESGNYQLIERLATQVLELIRSNPMVQAAMVEVDKPGALRFARSVSVEVSFRR